MDTAVEEFRSILDPFPVWLRGSLTEAAQGFVATEHLVTRYKFGRRGPAPQISYKQVAKAMLAEFPIAKADQRRVGGTGQGQAQAQGQPTAQGKLLRGWAGVSWRNPWP